MPEYLIFPDGQDRTREVVFADYVVEQPLTTCLPWSIVGNDRVPENYRLVNGAITYDPPAPEPVVVPPNMDLFFELFAKETMLGTFTAEQHGTMKLLADIKQDVAFRDQVLLNAMAGGTAEQKSKLLDIAAQSGVSLPLP